jgi:hypothetical protein
MEGVSVIHRADVMSIGFFEGDRDSERGRAVFCVCRSRCVPSRIVNALCTSFGLRPRRMARSWAVRLSSCIVAIALILAGSPALAMPSAARADASADAHPAHCAGSASTHLHDAHAHGGKHSHDTAHACCTSACPCIHACALASVAQAAADVDATGEPFRFAIAKTHASMAAPLLRPPIL